LNKLFILLKTNSIFRAFYLAVPEKHIFDWKLHNTYVALILADINTSTICTFCSCALWSLLDLLQVTAELWHYQFLLFNYV